MAKETITVYWDRSKGERGPTARNDRDTGIGDGVITPEGIRYKVSSVSASKNGKCSATLKKID